MKLPLVLLFFSLSVPAFAKQQCFEIFNLYRTVQGDKEYIVKLGHKYSYEDKTYGFKFEAILDKDGELFIDTELVKPQLGIRSHMHGSYLYSQMIQHFGLERIKAIRDVWGGGTNFTQLYTNLRNGMSPEDAAFQTWSGRQAALYGFTKIESFEFVKVQESEFGDIPYPVHRRPFQVLFTRP